MGKVYHETIMTDEPLFKQSPAGSPTLPGAPGSNVPEFSVSTLAFALKKTIEDNYGRVRVRGEIGRVIRAASGHIYTNLKDENASIDAVCWKGNAARLAVQPEEGLEVICTGKLTTYPGSSKYQIVIESLELAGEGALLKMLDDNYEGKTNDRRKIWTVYTFLTWYDVYFVHDGSKPEPLAEQ